MAELNTLWGLHLTKIMGICFNYIPDEEEVLNEVLGNIRFECSKLPQNQIEEEFEERIKDIVFEECKRWFLIHERIMKLSHVSVFRSGILNLLETEVLDLQTEGYTSGEVSQLLYIPEYHVVMVLKKVMRKTRIWRNWLLKQ